MTNRDKKQETAIIVVHEIYGVNEHMKSFCRLLAEQGFTVSCPNLLKRESPFEYAEEGMAYRYFMDHVGFQQAAAAVKSLLIDMKENYQKVFIIGFSVGATIAWLCSEERAADGIVGYYGSRIRDYTDITPECPVLLLFPQEELSFSVDGLIQSLSQKNVTIHKFADQHGFGDPCSSKYHMEAAETALHKVIHFLGS